MQMYQKAKMIAMIELDMPLDERREKKFWVEVKPSGCPEKKLFMVIHDDGVAATANPESATFPDSCEVSLHMPDADLLHKKEGIIVGVRHPVTQQYQVQLQDEQIRNAFGRMIVRAGEDSLRWRNHRGNSSSAAKAYSNDKELPTRPYIPPKNASDFTSPTPNTKATGYGPPLSVNPASPVIQRRQLASADSSNCITASGGGAASILSECNESNPSSFARMQKSPTKVIFNVPQPAALAHSEAPAISSPESFALPQLTSSKRPKRKSSTIEQPEAARARVSPVAAPNKLAPKRPRDEATATSLRSQRNLRNKK